MSLRIDETHGPLSFSDRPDAVESRYQSLVRGWAREQIEGAAYWLGLDARHEAKRRRRMAVAS